MATPQPQKRLRKKKKPPKKFRLSYSLVLLFAMIVVGSVAGLVAYSFGKQALEGVNPSPAGIKLPKPSPASKPKESPKASPQSQTDGKTSFFLDEAEVIAEMQARSQQELGGLTRPAFVAKANISDRKRIYKRVDRAYKSMRDPLAISADADARIAARIAALRQRVYASSRSTSDNFDRPVANNANSSSVSLSSAPVELTPIRDRWEDRDAALGGNPRQVTVEIIEVAPEPPSGSLFMPRQTTPNDVEINQR
ncbi:hypothetical protein VB774_01090 [Pseudanabaena galeata UHCC 0370]|uniref:Uncharacterized protein n=1 Tax=Pseudanabaena galeata UHCC 0370 TaxID=3110310 RepID=A0ABU5TES0_9CYAN|nr:hypothetical protein [Pseudanabaena galeata]MEA5476203.1 hypothetical protein [Pseudanabaena galeata UHCC 0370]